MWIYFWDFCPVSLIYISVFVPVSHYFSDRNFVVQTEIREPDSSRSVFLKIGLAICGLPCLHTNLQIFQSSSVKNAVGNLIGAALNLQIALGSTVILVVLILLIQERGLAFHLFVSSSGCFVSVLHFSRRSILPPLAGLSLAILSFLM